MRLNTKYCSFLIFLLFFSCFKIDAQPTISSFSPTKGTVGTIVIINGSNFDPIPTNNIVYFGSVKASVSSATNTSLTVTVPSTASYAPITVTTNTLTAYSTIPFTYTFGGNNNITSSSFQLYSTLNSGTGPAAEDIGDIDGDGKADLVVANQTTSTVSIYMSTGSGGSVNFVLVTDLIAGSSCVSVKLGDIDGDGKLDLAVANQTSHTISVFKNTSSVGSISFSSKIDFPVGSLPSSIAIGDLDMDGKPEIVVTDQYNTDYLLLIMRNTSTGGNISFVNMSYVVLGLGKSIFICDLNYDNKPDILMTHENENRVTTIRNLSSPGTINFDYPNGIVTDWNPTGVFATDLNGDGKPEMAVSNYSGPVSIFRNTTSSSGGLINFAPFVDYAAGTNPSSISVADLDGDGKPDIGVGNFGSNNISILKNNADDGMPFTATSFSSPVQFATGTNVQSIAIGDVNGDGSPEVISGNYGSNNVSILRNSVADASITAFTPVIARTGTTVTITGSNFSDASAVTFGGTAAASFSIISSTRIDAVVGNGSSGVVRVTTPHGVATTPSSSTLIFDPATITSVIPGSGPIGSTITINGSGFNLIPANNIVMFGIVRGTVTAATSTTLTVIVPASAAYAPISVTNNNFISYSPLPFVVTFTGNDNFDQASFAPKLDYPTDDVPTTQSIGDFDGDGRPDFAFAYTSMSGMYIYRNNGSVSSFSLEPKTSVHPTITANTASRMAVSDLNRDGKPDIIYTTATAVVAYRNTTSGGTLAFPATGTSSTTTSIPNGFAVGELNGDGKEDIVAGNFNSGSVSIFINNSTTSISYAAKVDFATGSGPKGIAVADFDGDGKTDVATVNYNDGNFAVLKNTTSGITLSLAAKVVFTTGVNPTQIRTGDFDGDGKTDVAVINSFNGAGGNSVSFFKNTSSGGVISFAPKVDFPTIGTPTFFSFDDLNGDGKPDFVELNSTSNNIAVFKNTSSLSGISFVQQFSDTTGPAPKEVAIADVDGDGRKDIIITNSTKTFSVFRNIINEPFIKSFTPTIGDSAQVITIKGIRFSGVTSVTVGGSPVTSFTIVNDSTISAVTAHVNSGDNLVSVTAPSGFSVLDGYYKLVPTELCPYGSAKFVADIAGGSTYRWYVDKGAGVGFEYITGDPHYVGNTRDTLFIDSIPSAWYGYQYRCIVRSANTTIITNGKIITLKFVNTWTGINNNSTWEDAGNWSCGKVPDINSDVIVNSGSVIINSDVTIRKLDIKPGASVTVASGAHLTITH